MTEPLVKQGFTLAISIVLEMLTFGYIFEEISYFSWRHLKKKINFENFFQMTEPLVLI